MKKTMSFTFLLLMILLAGILIVGCNSNSTSQNTSSGNSGKSNDSTTAKTEAIEKVEVLKIVAAHNQTTPNNPYQIGMLKFKEVVEEKSNGSITVEVHAGTLGTSEPEILESLELGAVDVMVSSAGFMTQSGIKEIDLLALPYLFESVEHWEKVVNGNVGKEIAQIINDSSGNKFKLLGFWSAGIRHYYGKKPLESIDDLSGMSIRTQTSGVLGEFWSSTGAVPTSVAWGELYQALQQNVVDSAENAYPFFVALDHHKASNGKFISETAHDFTTPLLLISGRVFDSLTDAQRDIILEAATVSEKTEREAVFAQTEEFKQRAIDEGAQVNQIDRTPFIELAMPIQDKWAESVEMADILEEVRNLK